MTRPAQKWLGAGSIFGAFLLILFTMAVPYVNHFGDVDNNFTYFTKWSGRWKYGQETYFHSANELYNFPAAAAWLIGLGLLITAGGAVYLFWLTYSNKPCYFTRERPGPVGPGITGFGILLYLIGSLIYERWAYGAPRPAFGWPGDDRFLPETVRISPTYWIGIVLAILVFAIAITSIVYYLDTRSKRPVK